MSQEKKIKSKSKLKTGKLNKHAIMQWLWIFGTAAIFTLVATLSLIPNSNQHPQTFDSMYFVRAASLFIIVTILLATLRIYVLNIRKDLYVDKKFMPILFACLSVSFLLCLLFGSVINYFAMPYAMCALLIAVLVDKRLAIIANVILIQAFFLAYVVMFGEMMVQSASSLLGGIISGTLMIIFLDKAYTRIRFLGIGVVVGLIICPVSMLTTFILNGQYSGEIWLAGFWSFLSSLLSVTMFSAILPLFEWMFKIFTNYRMSELSSLDSPLLKRLSIEAPGTFNHSMIVANLAEQCAIEIGENPQLARLGACYHDIGKLQNPESFIENQKGGYNVHDDLIPEVSVSLIISHTAAGEKFVKQQRLPDVIADIAIQHHGTTPLKYFFSKAQKFTEEQLKQQGFAYAGPKPQTKMACLIMIVDTVEAATRAVGISSDEKELRAFIHSLIDDKIKSDQFAEAKITFKDLRDIENKLVEILPHMNHHRIQYPNR